RRTKVDFGFVGDTKTTLCALLPKLQQKRSITHLNDSLEHYRNARTGLNQLATAQPGQKPIHPQYVVHVLDKIAAQDVIFSCDVGTPTIWTARYMTMNGKRRIVGSFNHGSMANALLHAIGAQASHPNRQVISLSGDGGLAMMLAEFLTLRQHNLPGQGILFQNDSLALV